VVDQAGAPLRVSDVVHQRPNQSLDGRRALWPGPAKFFFCCACAWAYLDLLFVCLLAARERKKKEPRKRPKRDATVQMQFGGSGTEESWEIGLVSL
jgi:hypothetical protein